MKRYNSLLKEQLSTEDIQTTIFNFFKVTPEIADADIHALAEKMGIAPDALETHIYGILRSIIGEGKSKDFTGDYDDRQILQGMKIESEHSPNKLVQKKIVLDHLAEFPNYYTALKQMEDQLKVKSEELSQEEITDNSITAI